MDQHNIAVSVSLDGGMRDAFDEHKKYLWTDYHDRFVILANIDWRGQGQVDKPETRIVSARILAVAWPRNWLD